MFTNSKVPTYFRFVNVVLFSDTSYSSPVFVLFGFVLCFCPLCVFVYASVCLLFTRLICSVFFLFFPSTKRLGTAGRLWVVVVSNALASPLAVGVLLAPYPWCFLCLLGAELLGEM